MSRAKEFICSKFPGLDEDSVEYVLSLATDESLTYDEKSSIIAEFIAGAIEVGNIEPSVQQLLELSLLDEQEAKEKASSRLLLTERAVKECLTAIRAPAVEIVSITSADLDDTDLLRKKELLKMYDPDSVANHKGTRPSTAEEEDEEIYGLGANENKLRKLREREDQRAMAKQEQEEAKLQRVNEKLKKQGEQLKGKTVVRSSRRS